MSERHPGVAAVGVLMLAGALFLSSLHHLVIKTGLLYYFKRGLLLLVFCLQVVPVVMGMRIMSDPRCQFAYTLVVGMVTVVVGAGLNYGLDLPTGAAIVCTFGLVLALPVVLEAVFRR